MLVLGDWWLCSLSVSRTSSFRDQVAFERLAAWVAQVQLLTVLFLTPGCQLALSTGMYLEVLGVDLLERVLALPSRPSLSFHFMFQRNLFSLPQPPE